MDSRSLSPKGTFDFSKSPYYQSLISFKKRPLPNILKSQKVQKSPLLQQTISERKRTEDQLANIEHRVMKMRRKEEQATHKLQTAKQRADMMSATRLQFEEVTVTQLETAKQQKREEKLKALMQKRKEIIDIRLANTQKMTSSRSEILEVKRVFST
jgi:undecaprenyl pyrophosphate synthase